MHKYEDATGERYQLEFDVETIRRVRKQTGFAFGTCLSNDMQPLNEMLDDYEQMPEVLYHIVQPEGIDQREFMNNCRGDAIERAQLAIWNAFAFFCPPRQRQMMEMVMEAETMMAGKKAEHAKEMMQTFIESQSTLEPSSESNQDPIPMAN